MRDGETGYLCSDGVFRSKQELFERMPVLRIDNWGCYRTALGFVWMTDEEYALVQG